MNQLVDGMAQLHLAARDGNIPALNVLLEFNPNLNIEVGLLRKHQEIGILTAQW